MSSSTPQELRYLASQLNAAADRLDHAAAAASSSMSGLQSCGPRISGWQSQTHSAAGALRAKAGHCRSNAAKAAKLADQIEQQLQQQQQQAAQNQGGPRSAQANTPEDAAPGLNPVAE